jgi:hypothetical protein
MARRARLVSPMLSWRLHVPTLGDVVVRVLTHLSAVVALGGLEGTVVGAESSLDLDVGKTFLQTFRKMLLPT